MAGLIGRLADLPKPEVSQLSIAMRRVITSTLEQSIEYPISPEGTIEPPAVYAAFVTLLEILLKAEYAPIALISFNYDIALDYALECSRIAVDYCLTSRTTDAQLDLLKLHGSLNWFRSGDEIAVARLSGPQTTDAADRTRKIQVPVQRLFAGGQSIPSNTDPVIVPPTWNKGQHHRDFVPLWRRAGDHLAEAENIIVIGYSAPPADPFYRYLYAISTISDTLLRRYLCFGPKVGQNHRALMGSEVSHRGVFSEDNSLFSACYPSLLKHLGLEDNAGLFGGGGGLGGHLTLKARGRQ